MKNGSHNADIFIRVLLFTLGRCMVSGVVVRASTSLHLLCFSCGIFCVHFIMPKRKHTLFTIKEKNELLDKLEKGVPVVNLVAEYGVAKQTIRDIRRNKEKIRAYAEKVRLEQGVSDPQYCRRTQRRTRNDYRVSCYYSIYIYL